jgi:uncharacterized membrane-anchored protein
MKTKIFIAVLALQAAWVIGTSAVQEARLRSAVVIHLETVPVDPRDLLRGDYVILRYKISTLDAALFAGGISQSPSPGTTVYVRLEKSGEFHTAAAASFQPLEADTEHPVVRAKVSAQWWGPQTTNVVHLDYGLERYFVREGTGNPTGKLTVDASVPHSGNAAIRQVYVDGKPYAEAMREIGK